MRQMSHGEFLFCKERDCLDKSDMNSVRFKIFMESVLLNNYFGPFAYANKVLRLTREKALSFCN